MKKYIVPQFNVIVVDTTEIIAGSDELNFTGSGGSNTTVGGNSAKDYGSGNSVDKGGRRGNSIWDD